MNSQNQKGLSFFLNGIINLWEINFVPKQNTKSNTNKLLKTMSKLKTIFKLCEKYQFKLNNIISFPN